MSKQFIYMQKLAGLIDENQYKKLLEDISLVDKILDKISKKGIESLNPKEKEYIDQYSKGENPKDWKEYPDWNNPENYYTRQKNEELFNMLKNAGVKVEWIDYSELGTSYDAVDIIGVRKEKVLLIIGYEVFSGGEGFIIELHGDIGDYEANIDRILFKNKPVDDHLTTKETFDAVIRFIKTDFKKLKPSSKSVILKSLGFTNYYKGSEALVYYIPDMKEYHAVPTTKYYAIVDSIFSMIPIKQFKSFEEFVDHFKKNVEGKYPNIKPTDQEFIAHKNKNRK